MRVLFWSGAFWPKIGGSEVRAARLLPALQKRGYEFVVVTSQTSLDLPQEGRFQGIPVYRFPFWKANRNAEQAIAIRQQIATLKRSFAPDLVHRNGVKMEDFFDRSTANAHPASLFVTLCNDLQVQSLTENTMLSRTFCSADWVSSVSVAALAQARQLAPEIIPRSSVIHNGIETEGYSPTPLPDGPPRLLCLGRLVPQKGIDLVLTAFVSVLRRWPGARLIVAGDGAERPALEHQANELGLTHAVDFLGWVSPDKVLGLISTATVVVMPSRWEGLPNVALQAALMARPVVGTRVGGIPEIVAHQETGLLVEPEDSPALAEAIALLLGGREIATRMGQAARVRVQREFGWEGYVDAYDALYRKLIRTRRWSPAGSNSRKEF